MLCAAAFSLRERREKSKPGRLGAMCPPLHFNRATSGFENKGKSWPCTASMGQCKKRPSVNPEVDIWIKK